MKPRPALSILLLLSAAAIATSCAPSAPPDNRAADAAALQTADEQWAATAAKNDVDGTVAFYADNAVLLPPNGPIITDRKSLRDGWAALLAPGTALAWKATKVQVASSGELGYIYGTYTMTMQDPKGGAPVKDTGKFVEVWSKQADGKWKCIVDTYNSDLPAEPAKK